MKCVLKSLATVLCAGLVLVLAWQDSRAADPIDPVQFALEMAARDIQAGMSPNEVSNRMLKRLRHPDVPFEVPRTVFDGRINIYRGDKIRPSRVSVYADRMAANSWFMRGTGGGRDRILLGWAEIDNFDPGNPCHRGLMRRARNVALEEVIHGFERNAGMRRALEFTPSYAEYLKRIGIPFDSEAYAYAFMEEHLGVRPSVDEIMRYEPERPLYYIHRNKDLIPGQGMGEIPSRPAPGPDFLKPAENGIDLLGDDPCLKRLKRLQKAADAAPPGTGKMASATRLLKGGGGKLLRGGGRALGVVGGVAGGVGVVNLVDATAKGGVLVYAEHKAVNQRNKLMWDLYHDPVYAGDPLHDPGRSGTLGTQGVNPKLRTVMERLSDSLWGNIEFGVSIVDIIP
jgi:hypothetical protein